MVQEVEYKLIPDYSDYCAGTDGSIWSRKSGEWKQLKSRCDPRDGRKFYSLCNNGSVRNFYGSILVLLTFVGPRPDGMEGCHNDGDCTNDNKNNIRWDTHKNNEMDKFLHGNIVVSYGNNNGNARIPDNEIPNIINRRLNGETNQSIADDYGVSNSQISRICNYRSRNTKG